MGIDWVVLTGKAPETIIVLIFVWFTLKILNIFQNFLTARDETYFANIQAVGNMHNKELETISKDIQAQTTAMTLVVDQMSDHTKLLQFIAEDVRNRKNN